MTKHRNHHPRSAVERTNLTRSKGGRGLVNIKNQHNKQNLSTFVHISIKNTTCLDYIKQLWKLTTIIHHKDWLNQSLFLKFNQLMSDDQLTKWQQKSLQGRHPNEVNSDKIEMEVTYKWLTLGYLYPETEGFLKAIQDQIIAKKTTGTLS
jgi:hypothetical protein